MFEVEGCEGVVHDGECKAAFDGRVYGYVVNTEAAPAEVTVPGYGAFRLEPYEFRAFKPVPRH